MVGKTHGKQGEFAMFNAESFLPPRKMPPPEAPLHKSSTTFAQINKWCSYA
jgi:hypothetical protein